MGYYKTRGLRGSNLEELINKTNEQYMSDDLAVIQKVPTPIKPIEIDSSKGVITLAYFDEKSTVDYLGVIQGIPVCFDAKETKGTSIPIANIHEHQIDFMRKFASQNGLSFLIVNFTDVDRYFIMDIGLLTKYYDNAKHGGRKSVPMDAFDIDLEVFRHNRYLVHYIQVIEKLASKEEYNIL